MVGSAVEIRNLFDEEVVKKDESCLMVDHIQVKRFYLLSMKSPHGQNRADITLNETLVKNLHSRL